MTRQRQELCNSANEALLIAGRGKGETGLTSQVLGEAGTGEGIPQGNLCPLGGCFLGMSSAEKP